MDSEMRKRFARDAAGLPEPREQTAKAFGVCLEKLAAFVRDHGRAPEAGADEPAEARLGSWLKAQVCADRKGRLSAERVARLEDVLGSGWSSRC